MTARIVLAHGAGAGQSHPWMRSWANRLSGIGPVHPFEYPYMAAGRRAPDRLPKLVAAHVQALHAARAAGPEPVVLAGKSMGSRVGCHVAAEHDVAALVCFGYPLRAPSGTLRDEVLLALRTPTLFVQGTRDPLCPLDVLDGVRARMTAPTTLHVVDGGDHSLVVGTRALQSAHTTQHAVDTRVLAAVVDFLEAHVG